MWIWIERAFGYCSAEPAVDNYGPKTERVTDWLNEIEASGKTVLDLHLAIAENGAVLAVAKVEKRN